MDTIKRRFISGIGVDIIYLLLIFLLSLSTRLYLLFEFPHVVFLHEADGMGYFAIAKGIVNNWALEGATHFPPFYPFAIAIVSMFTGDIEIAGRVASSLMGALLVFPVFLIGKEFYDKRVGYLSSLLVASFGAYIDYSLQPITQTTYLTLLMAGICMGIFLLKKASPTLAFLLGCVLGALYLTRPEGFVPFLYLFVIIFAAVMRKKITSLHRVKVVSLILFGFILLAIPYINYLHNQTGTWTISGKAAATIVGIDASAKILPDGKTLGESSAGKVGLRDLFPTFGIFVSNYMTNLSNFMKIVPDHFPVPCLIIAMIGLVRLLVNIFHSTASRSEGIFRLAVLFTAIVSILPVFAFGNLSLAVSYIFPLFPLLILWFVIGLTGIEDFIFQAFKRSGLDAVERYGKWSLASAAIVLYLGYFSVSPVWSMLSSEDFKYFAASQEFFLKDTGIWVKNNSHEDVAIMSRWSNMGFYADRKWVYIPDGEISEVVRYAKGHGVRYIVIDSNAVPRRRPKLAPLLKPSHYEGLRLVYAREEYWIVVIIYEVL